jgi:hypothetical protein
MSKQTEETFSEKELKETQEMLSEILEANWNGIQKMIGETEGNAGSVSLNVSLDHSGQSRAVKIKIGYAVKHTDETEFTVRDPAQTEMAI